MITKVHKYVILGVREDLNLFYERAQKRGFIEFIRLSKMQEKLPESIQSYLQVLKALKSLVPIQPSSLDWEDARSASARVLDLKGEIERFEEEQRLTLFEIARIAPFGQFSLEDIAYIEKEGSRKVQFFCAKEGKGDDLLHCYPELIYLNRAYEQDFFLSINSKLTVYPDLIEVRIDRSLDELLGHKDFLSDSIRSMHLELRKWAGEIQRFHSALIEELNAYHLERAKHEVYSPLEESSLFAVEAWIPDSKRIDLESMLCGLAVHVEPIKIEEGDSIPTVLENIGVQRLGEDLVRVYDCPAATDKDPSGWFFWFFCLFFSIIIADGGYGLVYLAFAAYLKWKFRTFTGGAKRLFRLFVILACFVVTWGVLTTSFFGLSIGQDSFFRKISPVEWVIEKKAGYHVEHKDETYREWEEKFPAVTKATNGKEFLELTIPAGQNASAAGDKFANNFLLEFSLILGIIHITCSLLRYVNRNWSGAGWVVFLLGGYLFAPEVLEATSLFVILGDFNKLATEAIGKQLMYAGIGLAMVLAVIQQGWKGIKEATNLIQVFSDVLSYLRLYALALAGSIMAETFNEMGALLGLFGGFLAILGGHGINIALGAMSGVIHGFRLNVIEWYHFSFQGGGRLFNPLRLVKLKED